MNDKRIDCFHMGIGEEPEKLYEGKSLTGEIVKCYGIAKACQACGREFEWRRTRDYKEGGEV